ncbi:DUF2935 domain-containing protein [Pseudalkalibacillus hwajinpoensis]|uniref:DUF2935 domain-containing protein n=1 Tax=Guptibacillus hwajinpoensis TaxID=208199 RepID=UPI00325ABD44
MKTFEDSAAFEHQFWLQILGDHARFIRDSLYPNEVEKVREAEKFIQLFDDYLEKARSSTDFAALTNEVAPKVRSFRRYKLTLLERQLNGDVGIHLSPTFFNHMVNELEEYLLVIAYLGKGEAPPVFHELHHHMLWLLDASGHAGAINDQLDGVEKRLKNRSNAFVKAFDHFYLKAVELTGYLRTELNQFPALSRFNRDVELEMHIFQTFLKELEEMELTDELLGTFSALMADHMAREECYYLLKVAESTHGKWPGCNPVKKRVE